MKLNAEGIDRLEAIMLANGKYFYNQNADFAQYKSCGTVLCAAGFARLLEVGEEQFNMEIPQADEDGYVPYDSRFILNCVNAGCRLLGIPLVETLSGNIPDIFNYSRQWPSRYSDVFSDLSDPKDKIKFYCDMLRNEVRENGSLLSNYEYQKLQTAAPTE